MAYSSTYASILNLLGSRFAHEIDDSSREAKAGLHERFVSILKDPAADPWELKDRIPDLVQRRHWSAGTLVSTNPFVGGMWLTPANATGAGSIQLLVPVYVPIGFKLVGLKFKLRLSAAGCQADIIAQKADAGGVIIGLGTPLTAFSTVSDWTDRDLGVIDSVCAAGDSYTALISLANGPTVETCQFMDYEATLENPA